MTRGPRRTETLARLLSGRDAPSVLEKEALFERIEHQLRADEQQKPRPALFGPGWWGLWSGAIATSAAALSLVFIAPSRNRTVRSPPKVQPPRESAFSASRIPVAGAAQC